MSDDMNATLSHLNWRDMEQKKQAGQPTTAQKKIPAGICGILLGALGVHKFILGYTKEGLIMLLVTLVTFGFGALVMGPVGLIEGIIYLTKSDAEFIGRYVSGRRGWF